MQALYRKIDPNVHGEELYDKNGNKLDGTYSKLNPDEEKEKKPFEIFDKKGNKQWG